MRHFLITRFNDYFPTFDDLSHATRDNPHKGIEEDWLESRLEIFMTITVPSVKYQSDSEFTWIIKCHPKTPNWARTILKNECFITSYEQIDKSNCVSDQASHTFTKLIRRMTNDKEIITSRLDSDDAISNDHIAIVKKYIRPNLFFDFSRGIVKNQWGIFIHFKPRVSQFCSYLETGGRLLTVYHKFHIAIRPEEVLKNQVDWGWMQHNHTTNITNGILSIPGTELQHMSTFNKVYPYKATAADWDALKLNYPFIKHNWLKIERPTMFV